jgi:S-formylglutathione hydrolase FrmB
VDTVDIPSLAMKRSFRAVVIKPQSTLYAKKQWPVVYLLHGYEGWYSNWIIRVPALKDYADAYDIIIVCPEGHMSSWYFDSPIDPAMKYETYIAKEVPEYIDANYPTTRDRKGRAITGLSMGGHGALYIAFRNSRTFGACGSMSGGMNLQQFRNKFDVAKRIGDSVKYSANWKNYSVITIVEKKPAYPLAIIFDCGIDDYMYPGNKALHQKLLKLKIPHEYIERPGNHSWSYWANAVEYQLLFFKNYFNR